MKLDQALEIVRAYKAQKSLTTTRDALLHMQEHSQHLSLEQFVAKDIASWGHSNHAHLLNK